MLRTIFSTGSKHRNTAYIKILVQFVPKVSSVKNSYPLDT